MNSDRGFRPQNALPRLPPPWLPLPAAAGTRSGGLAKSLQGPFQYLALMILAGLVVLLCLVRFKDQPIEGMGERSIAALQVTDVRGEPLRFEGNSGEVVFVSLWSTDCAPCIRDVPLLNEIAAEFRQENVRFLAVTFDPPGVALRFAARHRFELALAFASLGHLTEIAGVDGDLSFPTLLIYGHDGTLLRAYRRQPFRSTLEAALQAALERRAHGD